MRIACLAALFSLLCTVSLSARAAQGAIGYAAHIAQARAAESDCLRALPLAGRRLFSDRSVRQRGQVPKRLRDAVETCVERERDRTDWEVQLKLRTDLLSLLAPSARADAAGEADAIAATLIAANRRYARQFRMVGSPLFHNFLIKLKMKSGGYCYHWTRRLLSDLQAVEFHYFERLWGVANKRGVTENNSVLLRARGAEANAPGTFLRQGIAYDAWRGSGQPYWRWLDDDFYHWEIRLTEQNVTMGVSDIILGKEEL